MKLRGTPLFIVLALLGISAGYFAEPKLFEICFPEHHVAGQTTKKASGDATAKDGPAIGNKEKIDLGDLLGDDDTPKTDDGHSDEIVDIPPSDDDKIDPSSFGDSEEVESEEETAKRLNAFKKRPASDSSVVLVAEEAYVGDTSAGLWANPKTLKRRLGSRIRARLKGTSPEEIATFLKVPEHRLMLAQWQLLHNADEKKFSDVMKDRKLKDLVAPLLNDLPWVTSFVYDGELNNPEIAIAILGHLRQADPNMDLINITEEKGEMLRDPHFKWRVAGAIAAEYANNKWMDGEEKVLTREQIKELKEMGMPMPKSSGRKGKVDTYRLARERYFFFAEGVNDRLFNPNFYTTPGWLMRFICGWKGDNAFGSANTMRWQRDNNSAPAKSYLGLGHVPYLPTNIFGDSIHGPYYYQPFSVLYPDNLTKMTRDIGSVCGGISHYGASAACANGIPAFTMGEPGHCAFAVYSDEKWVPCNSIFPEKFPHWSLWGDSTWSALTLYTNMYHDGQRTRDAQLICTLAELLAEYSNPNNALKAYETSIAMQPINRATWNSYVATAVKTLKRSPKRWMTVNSFLCSSMAPTNPSACATFLQEQIYPSMLSVLRGKKEKMEAYDVFFKGLDKQEENVWKIDVLLDMQLAALGRSSGDKRELFEMAAKYACEKPEFGLALTWAIRSAYTDGKLTGKKMMEEVVKYRESSPNIPLVDAAIIRAAEELQDEELFHKYSAPYTEGLGGMPDLPHVAGNLISNTGIISLSSYSDKLEDIVNHAAALGTNGGSIQSEGGKHQKVTVILPKAEKLGAIIIVPSAGSASSYYEWNVEISKDGKDWEEIAVLPERSQKPTVNLIINKSNPTAKYIRIDSGSDQTLGIKFKAILIYDTKKVK